MKMAEEYHHLLRINIWSLEAHPNLDLNKNVKPVSIEPLYTRCRDECFEITKQGFYIMN